MILFLFLVFVFFFKQKTAYEMRISDWSSDVCSSDLLRRRVRQLAVRRLAAHPAGQFPPDFCTIRAPPSGRGRRSSAFWVFQIFRSISMKENFVVVAEPRADQGKGASRRLRRTGKVPAIVYGGKEGPVPTSSPGNAKNGRAHV